MVLTPVELETRKFSKGMRGYNSEEVDKFLKTVLKEYEAIYRENQELKETCCGIEQDLGRYKNLENTITETLVTAQKAAEDARNNAVKESELIIREAKVKAEEMFAKMQAEVEKKQAEYRELVKQHQVAAAELKIFLLSHLEMLEKGGPDLPEDDSESEDVEILTEV